MQLRHGDNLGKGFCTSKSAYKSQLPLRTVGSICEPN